MLTAACGERPVDRALTGGAIGAGAGRRGRLDRGRADRRRGRRRRGRCDDRRGDGAGALVALSFDDDIGHCRQLARLSRRTMAMLYIAAADPAVSSGPAVGRRDGSTRVMRESAVADGPATNKMSEAITRTLPFLRRYASAVTGSQKARRRVGAAVRRSRHAASPT